MRDQKALRILYHTHWSSAGWKRNFAISSDDFSYARDAGYMFDPVYLTHDEIVQWLKNAVKAASLEDISNAFLRSLSTRHLELRSTLGSYAIAKNFPFHHYQSRGYSCEICGIFYPAKALYDFSVLNFERFKWGGVRHGNPEYIAFDLEQFNKIEISEPTKHDFGIMRQILAVVKDSEAQSRPRVLEKRLANVFESNKSEREILIQILAYCGIIQPQNHVGYFQTFVNHVNRTIPPVNKIDWKYPVCWWRGSDGINLAALQYYFPQYV
jgi:hypothetical protein